MEVSKAFQADIRRIQNQLKIAILNHQVMVKKKNEDPTNIHIQVQLRDAQRHIISLGEIQKQLIQRLRKELEANSTNSTLNNKTTIKCTEKDNDNDIEITQTKNCSSSSTGGIGSTVNTKNSITSGSEDTSKTENGIIYCSPGDNLENSLEDEIRLSEVSSPSSSSSSYSDDEREIQESLAAEISQEKIAFLQAVGLITREILSDLQNRRVERKRRSTANHTQFVYGSHWDVSKRKKNGYLLSTSPPAKTKRKPQVHQKQQLHQKDKHHISFAENDRIVLPVTSTLEKVAPVSSSVSQSSLNRQTTPDKTNASAYQITPKEISRSLLRTSGTNLPKTSLRLASLPASLTIERVNSPPNVCIICGSTGMLSSCKNCSVYFHPSCSKEASCCPKCNTDQGSTYIETKNGPNEPPNGLIIQQTTVPLQASFSECRALKQRLAHVNSRLESEKNLLGKRAAELTISLEAQASEKKVMRQSEELIRNKIQVINNFISVIKTNWSVEARDEVNEVFPQL